jgi:hypothetical protein
VRGIVGRVDAADDKRRGPPGEDRCASPKLHPVEKLNRCLDILTVKSRLDRPNRASWKAMKTQADGILARDRSGFDCSGSLH